MIDATAQARLASGQCSTLSRTREPKGFMHTNESPYFIREGSESFSEVFCFDQVHNVETMATLVKSFVNECVDHGYKISGIDCSPVLEIESRPQIDNKRLNKAVISFVKVK